MNIYNKILVLKNTRSKYFFRSKFKYYIHNLLQFSILKYLGAFKMTKLYSNHSHLSKVYKHNTLPITITEEFDLFWLCWIQWNFIWKNCQWTISWHFRNSNISNRNSQLFPNQKLSHWSVCSDTSCKEIKKHGSNKNILTFWT